MIQIFFPTLRLVVTVRKTLNERPIMILELDKKLTPDLQPEISRQEIHWPQGEP